MLKTRKIIYCVIDTGTWATETSTSICSRRTVHRTRQCLRRRWTSGSTRSCAANAAHWMLNTGSGARNLSTSRGSGRRRSCARWRWWNARSTRAAYSTRTKSFLLRISSPTRCDPSRQLVRRLPLNTFTLAFSLYFWIKICNLIGFDNKFHPRTLFIKYYIFGAIVDH